MSFYANYSSALGGGGGGGGGPFLPLSGGTMSGDINLGGHNIVNGGVIGQGVGVHTVTDGDSFQIADSAATQVLFNTVPVASATTYMPINPIVGEVVTISFVGGGGVTSWTLNPQGGHTFAFPPPTTISSGQAFSYVFVTIGPTHYWVLVGENLDGGPFLLLSGGTLTGNLLFSPDSVQNIGASGADRPGSVFLANTLDIGSDTISSLNSPQLINFGAAQFKYDINVEPSILQIITSSGSTNADGGGVVGITGGLQVSAGYFGFSSAANLFTDAGTGTSDSSAVLTLLSTDRGFLPPAMTTTQKNAIVFPAPGLLVYDTTLNKLSLFTGAAWETVTSV